MKVKNVTMPTCLLFVVVGLGKKIAGIWGMDKFGDMPKKLNGKNLF